MRKKRKVTQELINRVTTTSATRSDLDYYFMGFLRNFTEACELFDFIKNNSEERLVARGLSQYVVSLVSICETFFRDVFAFIIAKDPTYSNNIVSAFNLRLEPEATVPESMNLINFLPEFFNFQRIDDLLKVFNPLFMNNFIDEIGNVVVPLIRDGKVIYFSLNRSLHGWYQLFTKLLDERHNITHDANYRTQLTLQEFSRIEKMILYFCQVFIIWVSSQYHSPLIMMSTNIEGQEINVPFLFTLDDILNGEWELVDES